MKHYAALDVSLKETSACIVDRAGQVVREVSLEPKLDSHVNNFVHAA